MARLTFAEFIDLALARVAEADRDSPGEYIDLYQVAADLNDDISDQWVFDAAKHLDYQGLVNWMKVMGRTAPVALTGDGRLYVEQGGVTGVIAEYREQPWQFVLISGEGHNVAVSQTGGVTQAANRAEGDVFVLLSQIENGIEADQTLSPEAKAAAQIDLQAVRGQLQKPEPNRTVIKALLEPMTALASVGSLVLKLIEVVG
jgi:hypothetical protein